MNGLTFGGGCLMNTVEMCLFMYLKKQLLKQQGSMFFLFLLLHYSGLNISISVSLRLSSVLSLYFAECPQPACVIKRCLASNIYCLLSSPENHGCLWCRFVTGSGDESGQSFLCVQLQTSATICFIPI